MYKIQSTIYFSENEIIQDIYIEKELFHNISYDKNFIKKGKKQFFQEINSFFINNHSVAPQSINYETFSTCENIKITFSISSKIEKIQIDWQLLPDKFLPKGFNNKSNWTLSPLDFSSENILSNDLDISKKSDPNDVYILVKSVHEPIVEYIINNRNNQILWQEEQQREIYPQQVIFTQKKHTVMWNTICVVTLFLLILASKIAKKIKLALVFGSLLLYQFPLFSSLIVTSSEKIPEVSTVSQKEIFLQLHQNIYACFDYYDKFKIYDVLSTSSSGKILEEMYLEIFQSVVSTQKRFVIEKIDTLETKILPSLDRESYGVKCQWRVNGWVIHMGHKHQRINEYEAVYTIANVDSYWKIVDCKILRQVRLEK